MLSKFTEISPEENLAAHVKRQVAEGKTGPWIEESLICCTRYILDHFSMPDLEAAQKFMSDWWGGSTFGQFTITPIHPIHEWNSHIRDLMTGFTSPSNFPTLVLYPGKKFQVWSVVDHPLIIVSDDEKTRWWGMIRLAWPAPEGQQNEWALQNFQLVRSPVFF